MTTITKTSPARRNAAAAEISQMMIFRRTSPSYLGIVIQVVYVVGQHPSVVARDSCLSSNPRIFFTIRSLAV
jgi:hypothetical protein